MDNCGRNEAAGLKLVHFHKIGSTNVTAFKLASQGAEEWTVVASDTQTEGRGRHGKAWNSGLGGLYMSVILRPGFGLRPAGLLQILGGTSALSAVREETGVEALLKWPNDLVLESKKLGGVLVEARSVQNELSFAVVGIGLNVNQTEELLPEGATSIFQHTSRRYDLQSLLVRVVEEMRSRYALLGDSARLVSEWWDHCVHKQRAIRVEGSRGVVVGLSKGISPEGQLIIETSSGGTVNIDEGTLTVAGLPNTTGFYFIPVQTKPSLKAHEHEGAHRTARRQEDKVHPRRRPAPDRRTTLKRKAHSTRKNPAAR